jgi:hypothetical protein
MLSCATFVVYISNSTTAPLWWSRIAELPRHGGININFAELKVLLRDCSGCKFPVLSTMCVKELSGFLALN